MNEAIHNEVPAQQIKLPFMLKRKIIQTHTYTRSLKSISHALTGIFFILFRIICAYSSLSSQAFAAYTYILLNK